MEEFLEHFKERTRSEQRWLSDVFEGVRRHLYPLISSSMGLTVEQLTLAVLSKVQRAMGSEVTSLPVSYRFVSLSELTRQQHTACCSSLSWSSAHYREQARRAERALPDYRALPRDNILLIGYLCDGPAAGASDGVWWVRDAGGSVPCEMLKSSPLWLGRLMFFPTWNYIPQNAPAGGGTDAGYLELLDPPVCVTPEPMTFDPGGSLTEAMGVKKAAELLKQRCDVQVCVSGQVRAVSPLLLISARRFFCLILSEEDFSVPVLITEVKHQYWRQTVCVGQYICISAVRVCSLRGWAEHSVLSVTAQSRLHPHVQLHENTEDPETHLMDTDSHSPEAHVTSHTHVTSHAPLTSHAPDTHATSHAPDAHVTSHAPDTHATSHAHVTSHTPDVHATSHAPDAHVTSHAPDAHVTSHAPDAHATSHVTSHAPLSSHAPDTRVTSASCSATPVRTKHSTVISYKGLITKVLNAEAGLYEIDGKVGLCLAYQPVQKCGGGLRPGTEIQLHNIHFLYRPSPFAPDVVLCACLRSSVQITAFSPLSSGFETTGTQSSLQRHLLEKNLGASQYLWLCYCQGVIKERLCPRWVREERVCVVAGRLLDCVCDTQPKTNRKRDIYREMLQEAHQCPVTTYYVSWPSVVLWSVRQLCDWMNSEVWSSLSLSSLLPPAANHMTGVELNASLAWSVNTVSLTKAHSQPLMLVGVLELSSVHGTLQFRDQTQTLNCVCVETDQSGARITNISTAWLGCLVCLRRCTLVMERFMKTHFPSWKHLDQPSYITHKHCRVYLQLCVSDLIIISPSAAMSISLMEKKNPTHRREDGETSNRREAVKRGRDDDDDDDDDEAQSSKRPLTPCVSLIFRLQSKQGVMFRNSSVSDTRSHSHKLQLGFTARVTALGDVQRWNIDPKNRKMQERETDGQNTEMEMHFVDVCVHWFPILHPGSLYRLIALNTKDVSVLKAESISVRGGVKLLSNPALLINHQWKIHTLTDTQSDVSAVMTVSEVLHSSSAPEIVSFYGVISQRITLQEDTGTKSNVQSVTVAKDSSVEEGLKVRLTVQDPEASGQMIQVYVDLSCGPYTPGLLPGASLLLNDFQRKVSKACNVYCRSLPISCVTITGLGSVGSGSGGSQSPPPMMLLGDWASGGTQQCIVGQVKGHVVCVLSLRLQWMCSLCGSIFRQGSCSRSPSSCDSVSAVFQAEAKVVVEDGSGEAQVWFSSDTICELLMLDAGQWEGLQRHIRVKGYVRVYIRGRNMMCDVDPEDSLVQYLCCLCSSNTVCRQINLTCRHRAQRTGKSQLRKVCRGPTEFICKFPPALQLHCLQIHTDTH